MKKNDDLLCIAQQRWKKTIRIMKLTVGLLLMTIITATAVNTYSQNARISLKVNDGTILDIFREIERNSEFGFFYKSEEINLEKRQSIEILGATIDDILKKVLDENYSYKILDKNIVVTKGSLEGSQQQPRKVSGKVTDSSGATLPGVSVVVKGTTDGVITDRDGTYSFNNIPINAVLQFSFVGMKEQEIAVGTLIQINVAMYESAIGLEEVVVIGYGTVKKRDLTGSVASVKPKDMVKMALNDPAKSIMGKVAGVLVYESNVPGGSSSLLIRGKRSITASNAPLLVVDGVPIVGGDLKDFPVSDIMSMEVLKDASATAIYGSRAANGVVLITTKRGEYNGKGKFEYNGYYGIQTAANLQPYMNPAQYMQRNRWYNWSQGLYADPNHPTYSEDKTMRPYSNGSVGGIPFDPSTRAFIDAAWSGGTYNPENLDGTNWQDILYRNGSVTDHQLSFTGGEKNLRTYMAGGFYKNVGLGIYDEYQRFSFRANIDYAIKKWWTITFSSSNTYSKNPSKGYDNTTYGARNNPSFNLIPISKPYFEDGSINMLPGNDSGIGSFLNPLLNQDGREREYISYRFLETLTSNINFGHGLSYKLQVSFDGTFANDGEFNGQYSSWGLGNKTALGIGVNRADWTVASSYSYLMENIVNFNPDLGPKHSFLATLLTSFQTFRSEGLYYGADNNEIPYQKWYNMAGYPDNRRVSSSLTNSALQSYLGRVNYSFLNKYLLTGSIRVDGSSVFSTGNKYDYFPSFAVAWKINEESFLKNVDFVNQLKLRFGYGVTGNSAVSPGQTLGTLRKTGYLFQQSLGGIETPLYGYAPKSLNTTLKWEKTGQYNIGLDFELLKGVISGSVDLYSSKTTDLIMPRKLPVAAAGLEDIVQNIGQTSNKGIEVLLSSVNVNKKDFRWTTDFTFSYNKERIDKIYKEGDDIDNGWFIGQPIDVVYFYDFVKILDPQVDPDDQAVIDGKNTAEGLVKYKPGDVLVRDLTGDNKITAADRMILGHIRPDYIGGLTNTLSFKGFDFSFMLYAKYGNMIGMNYGTLNSDRDNAPVVNYWTPGNAESTFPRLRVGQPNETYSIGLVDGSFLRLRNVNLTYNFSSEVTAKLRLSKLSVYAAIQNPYVIWKNKNFIGTDPENATGIGANAQPTTTMFGISVGF